VGGAELDLAEQVAPVGGQRREGGVPRFAQGQGRFLGRRLDDWIRGDDLELRADELRVESLEEPADAVALSGNAERQHAGGGAKRLQRSKQLGGAIAARGVLERDSDPSLAPPVAQRIPLLRELHLAKVHSVRSGKSREATHAFRGPAARLPPRDA